MVGGGDLVIWVAPNSVLFLSSSSSLRKKMGRGIYTPPRIVAIVVLQGRIFRSKYGPDNPAWLDILVAPNLPAKNRPISDWRAPWVLSQFRGGTDYLARSGKIRPIICLLSDWRAPRPSQVLSWILGGPDYLARSRNIWPIIRPYLGDAHPDLLRSLADFGEGQIIRANLERSGQ
jgi:hypothetical protein